MQKDVCDEVKNALNKYGTSYYGFFDCGSVKNNRQRKLFPIDLRFSGRRTYFGKDQLRIFSYKTTHIEYMKPSIDLSEPQINRIRITKSRAANIKTLIHSQSEAGLKKLRSIQNRNFYNYLQRKTLPH